MPCTTVGYFLDSDSKMVRIAMNMGPGSTPGELMAIPTPWILKITKLRGSR